MVAGPIPARKHGESGLCPRAVSLNPKQEGLLTTMRILVIDDEVSIREVIVDVLEAAGHTVIEAKDGFEGLKLNSATPADLIITDLFMPNMDGMTVLLQLRQQMSHAKVITISGGGQYGDRGFLKAAKLLGSTYTLEKPFTPGELLELVERIQKEEP